MPRNIAKFGRPLPYFMRHTSPYYAKFELSKSPSNMNRLCWDIERWITKTKFAKEEKFDYHLMIDESVGYDDEAFEKVEQLFLDFCKEYKARSSEQAVIRKYTAKWVKQRFTQREANDYVADWKELYERYKQLANDICPNEQMLANICVLLVYEKYPKKFKKFPWIVASRGLLKNIPNEEHFMCPFKDENGERTYLGNRYTMIDINDMDIGDDYLDDVRIDDDDNVF